MINGRKRRIYDPMGKDTTLFHHAADEDRDSLDSRFVAEANAWFDSVWTTIARPIAI